MGHLHQVVSRWFKGSRHDRRPGRVAAALRSAAVESLEARRLLAAVLDFSAIAYSVAENVGTATITVNRSTDLAGTVTVDFATSDGTATQPGDYLPATGTLTFAPNVTSQSFTVTIVDDALAEGAEALNLALSNPTGGALLGTESTATLDIVDNEPGIQFAATSFSVSEAGFIGPVTLIRTGSLSGVVSVVFSTSNGTALAGADYVPVSQTVDFPAGASQVTVTVPIIQDLLVEGNEVLNLALSSGTGMPVGALGTATMVIVDDDSGFFFTTRNFNAAEDSGSGSVLVERNGATSTTATVSITTVDQTATGGQDYTPISPPLDVVFGPGETSKLVPITILPDTVTEGDEIVKLQLLSPQGQSAVLVLDEATLTILNDDSSFQFSQLIYHAREDENIAAITVNRVGDVSAPATVDFSVSGGSATAGADFGLVSGALSFAPGQTSQVFTIPLVNDSDAELTETIDLFLTNGTGNGVVGTPAIAYLQLGDFDNHPPQVVDATMVRQGGQLTGIRLQFNEPMNPGDFQNFADHYAVFSGGKARAVPLRAADYDAGAFTVTLSPRRPLSRGVMYQVNVRSDLGLTDLHGNPVDGNGDGTAGDSFRTFIGFGPRLSYTDHNGDLVRLVLSRGGSMEVVQRGDREAQFVRVFDAVAGRSLLSGTLWAGRGGDAVTRIAQIIADGAQVQLPDPPFVVGSVA